MIQTDIIKPSPYRIKALIVSIVLVCAVVFIVHMPALSARAVSFDDAQYLINNKLVKSPGWTSAQRFLTEVIRPSTVEGYYQPLSMISLMIDYAMGGREDNLMPFHRTSLIIHTANTALVILLLYLIFGHVWVAAIVGLLFGLHPLTVETIPWVSERKTLLGAFFAFACLLFYVRFAHKKNWRAYTGCFLLYVLALMSKPTTVLLPLAMLVMDYWPLRRLKWQTVWEKIPLLMLGGISAVITYTSQKSTSFIETPQEYGFARIPLVLCHNLIFYLLKIIWPVNLSSHYAYPDPLSLSDPMVLTGIIGTAILIPLLLVSLRWTNAPMAGGLFFLVVIMPTMQIIGFSDVIASDKFVYLPSMGLLMLLAWFLIWGCYGDKIHKPIIPPQKMIAILLILAGLEAIVTRQYLTYWKDTTTLYTHMLEVRPNAVTLNYDFGNMLLEEGKIDEAVGYLRKAFEHLPNNSDINNNLGVALMMKGNPAEAIPHFQKILDTNSNDIEANCNLANAMLMQNRFPEAVSYYRRVLEIYPDDIKANNGIGLALWKQGNSDEALEHFYKVLRIHPDAVITHQRAAGVLESQGKLSEAIKHYRQALQYEPNDINCMRRLSFWLATSSDPNIHDPNSAVKYAERAADLTKHQNAAVLETLSVTYAAAGNIDKAVTTAQTALTLALAAQDKKLVEQIRQRLESYKQISP
jgi:protein O-mannosyl-transferase